jgi:hypothetical protein
MMSEITKFKNGLSTNLTKMKSIMVGRDININIEGIKHGILDINLIRSF